MNLCISYRHHQVLNPFFSLFRHSDKVSVVETRVPPSLFSCGVLDTVPSKPGAPMGAQHQSTQFERAGRGKGQNGSRHHQALCKTEFTLTCVLWEHRSGKFTEQDGRIPSDWALKTPGVTRASPRRLYPESGRSAWSPGAEPAGSVGGDFLASLYLCESWAPGGDLGKQKSILPAALSVSFGFRVRFYVDLF